MAQYDLTYSCGHKGEICLAGEVNERKRKIEWMETSGDCPECYKSKQIKKTEEIRKSQGLLNLEGSEKQIAWAEKIRDEKIKSLTQELSVRQNLITMGEKAGTERVRSIAKEKGLSDSEIEKQVQMVLDVFKKVEVLENFKTTNSSKWIIDNR